MIFIWQSGNSVKITKLTYTIIDPFILQACVSLHTVLKTTNLNYCQQRFLSKPPNIMFANNSAYTVFLYINIVIPYTGKFWHGKNWWIWQIMSYSPNFSSPIFTDTPKMYLGYALTVTHFPKFPMYSISLYWAVYCGDHVMLKIRAIGSTVESL